MCRTAHTPNKLHILSGLHGRSLHECVCVCMFQPSILCMMTGALLLFHARSYSIKNFTGMTTLQNNISSTFNGTLPASPNSVHPPLSARQRVNVGLIYVVRAQRVILLFFFFLELFFLSLSFFDLPTCTKDFYHVNFYCVWFLPHIPLFTMWAFPSWPYLHLFCHFYILHIEYIIGKQMFLMHQ